jgi:hypothetical protein
MATKANAPIAEETVVDPEAAEPPPPPATIDDAIYDYDGVTVLLMITVTGATEQQPYALTPTDQYGMSPWLREELQRMIDAGEITVKAAPQMPAEDE